jgi:hypothetical protein
MSEPLYTAQATVEQVGSLQRRARLPSGESFEMGVHGPIVAFYKLLPARELPLPVDFIVAATGG